MGVGRPLDGLSIQEYENCIACGKLFPASNPKQVGVCGTCIYYSDFKMWWAMVLYNRWGVMAV